MDKFARLGIVVLVVVGCGGFAGDSVWMQQKLVAIGTTRFQECVTTAVASVPGVSVNRAVAGSANKVPLDVRLVKSIPFLNAEVQYRKGNVAGIVFVGGGATESDADRRQVTPVIQSIADAIVKSCGSGTPKR